MTLSPVDGKGSIHCALHKSSARPNFSSTKDLILGQVPQTSSYLIIGSGRVARHLSFYLDHLEIPYQLWHRGQSKDQLKKLLLNHANVLVAVRDDAIIPFYQEHKTDENVFIHFSGQIHHDEILGFHPLMTFTEKLYDNLFYKKIPFVGTHSEAVFRVHFPSWDNPYYQIDPDQKDLYHSLCVLAGNGTTLLWELAQRELKSCGLPPQLLTPFLEQVSQHIVNNSPGRFTGPWYRGDEKTLNAHEQSLASSPLAPLYKQLRQLAQSLDRKS